MGSPTPDAEDLDLPAVQAALDRVSRTAAQGAALALVAALGFVALAMLLRTLVLGSGATLAWTAATLLAVFAYLILDRWLEARLQRRAAALIRTLAAAAAKAPSPRSPPLPRPADPAGGGN